MGGGGSIPRWPKFKVDKYPGPNLSNGLQASKAEGCAACNLEIPLGMSSSTVAVTRAPDKLKDDSERPSVFYPTNTLIIKPSAPFKGKFNAQIPNTFTSDDITFNEMQLFYGSPIRVKNKMSEACILVLSEDKQFMLGIPITVTDDGREPSTKFFSALAPAFGKLSLNAPAGQGGYDPETDPNIAEVWKENDTSKQTEIDNYIKYRSGGHYDTNTARKAREEAAKAAADYKPKTVTISTGSEWSLSSLITGDSPYFTWVDTPKKLKDAEQYNEDPWFTVHHMMWQDAGLAPLRVFFFQDSVFMLSSDFAALTSTIQVRDPSEVIQSMTKLLYHPGKPRCKDCAGVKKAKKSFSFANTKKLKNIWDSPAVQWTFFFLVLAIMFLVISGGISYVNDNPNNIFAVVARGIRPPTVPR